MIARISEDRIIELIRLCQEEAEVAILERNVPIASVITDFDGEVVIRTHNTQISDHDPSAHAELKAVRMLGKLKGSRYLEGHVVFSSAETCVMCMAACINARIQHFCYGAHSDPTMDLWVPMVEVAAKCKLPLEIHGPILPEECAAQIARGRALL